MEPALLVFSPFLVRILRLSSSSLFLPVRVRVRGYRSPHGGFSSPYGSCTALIEAVQGHTVPVIDPTEAVTYQIVSVQKSSIPYRGFNSPHSTFTAHTEAAESCMVPAIASIASGTCHAEAVAAHIVPTSAPIEALISRIEPSRTNIVALATNMATKIAHISAATTCARPFEPVCLVQTKRYSRFY